MHPLYDNYGNPTSVTDPNDNVTQFIHDHLNRLIGRAIPLDVETVSDATDYVEPMAYNTLDQPPLRRQECHRLSI